MMNPEFPFFNKQNEVRERDSTTLFTSRKKTPCSQDFAKFQILILQNLQIFKKPVEVRKLTAKFF